MSYQIIWREQALNTAARFLKDDPEGLRQVFASVDLLAEEPRPPGTATYGSPDLRRLHVGFYRIMYEVTDSTVTIVIMHLGRAG
ncbi:type II toxin-antitoxin system RelE family toxin [Streptomyces sp. NPDC000941]